MPSSRKFDYLAAFGKNPWVGSAAGISSLLSELAGSLRKSPYSASRAASLDTSGDFSARPDDPEVGGYMAHVLGGQRNLLDDYVRRTAGAGIKRGGLNVRGGPALDSALHHSAMSALATGYADRFREAMSYNKQQKAQLYSQYKDRLRNMQSLLALKQKYLSSEADWQNRLGNLMHGDWQREVESEQQAPLRQVELERALGQLRTERWKNAVEQQERRAEVEKKGALERAWKGYQAKANRPLGVSWTPGELMGVQRTMVELGLINPRGGGSKRR
jgi:hypothetical protein